MGKLVNPLGGVERRRWQGRLVKLVKLVNPLGGVERRRYDAAGNLLEVEEAHGVRRRFEYDKEQNLTRTADGLRDVSFTYTGYHRLYERLEAGTAVRFHYDTEEQLLAVENEHGERYRFELDACGRVASETGFDDFTRRYTRDAAGRVTRVDKPSGRREELSYDAAGRILDVRRDDGSFERYRYDAAGQLIEASNPTAEVLFERDAMGRVERERTRPADGPEGWVQSGYGPDGERVRVSASDGHLHHIERDDAGEVRRVELEHGRWGVDFERDALGLEVGRRLPGGVASRWDRDAVGRPLRRTVSSGERQLDDRRYEWEGDDQIRAILSPTRGDAHYRHDARGRLVGARLPWGEVQHRAMDAVGNVYRRPDLGDRRYGKGGRLEEAEGTRYLHDEDGNLVEKTDVLGDTTRYRWNGAGMLEAVALPDGREVRFGYDVLARRLQKTVLAPAADGELVPAKEVRWSWDGHVPLTELDSERGKTTWVFEPETFNPLAKLSEGKVWGVLVDQIGTPTELVAEDGSVAWRGTIDVRGEMALDVRETDCPFRWPGQQADETIGLVYNKWRYYDSDTDRYLSPDPLGLLGHAHAFSYVRAPTTHADPLAWHTVLAWLNGAPVRNPRLGGRTVWPNVHGSGGALTAPSGLGRLGDSENLLLDHLTSTRSGELAGGFLEIESVRRGGLSSLPPCDLCSVGLQTVADNYSATIVYRVTDGFGPDRVVVSEQVFRRGEPVEVRGKGGCGR